MQTVKRGGIGQTMIATTMATMVKGSETEESVIYKVVDRFNDGCPGQQRSWSWSWGSELGPC